MEEVGHPATPFGDFLNMMAEMGAAEHVWATIDICARYGGFYADETRCLIARPVDSSIGIHTLNGFGDLVAPLVDEMKVDAWFILYAVGGINSFFELAPYELPRLVWQRDGQGDAKIYDFQKIKHRVHAMSPPKPPATPKPDPNTVASGIDQNAQREAELERKRKAGFYAGFRKTPTGTVVGGENQPLG